MAGEHHHVLDEEDIFTLSKSSRVLDYDSARMNFLPSFSPLNALSCIPTTAHVPQRRRCRGLSE